jgi:hypothetical protein
MQDQEGAIAAAIGFGSICCKAVHDAQKGEHVGKVLMLGIYERLCKKHLHAAPLKAPEG